MFYTRHLIKRFYNNKLYLIFCCTLLATKLRSLKIKKIYILPGTVGNCLDKLTRLYIYIKTLYSVLI